MQLFDGQHEAAFRNAQSQLRNGGAPDANMVLVLATIALEHDNLARAQELAGMAEQIGGAEGWHHIIAGRLALARSDTAEARAHALAATGKDIVHPAIAGQLGVLLSRTGLHAEAVPWFEIAAAARPTDALTAYNLAIAHQFTGDLDAARREFRALLAHHPDHARAWLALVQLDRQQDAALLDTLVPLFEPGRDSASRLALGHAIAKLLEDLGRWDESFAWLERAKTERRTATGHDRAASALLFEAAARSADIELPNGPGDPAPIFIVGLPRTGTTLVERIVSAHPQVRSAGELSDFAVLLKRRLKTPGGLVLDDATITAGMAADLSGIEHDYVTRARSIVGPCERFIDKMPFNLFYVPLILKALPGARIICLRRSPMDAAFSNFRQLFATGFTYYSYAYDFDDTAAFVAGFEALADHYADVLPPERFMTQRYEDIVADFEGSARALLAFTGLPWDDSCLAFHENAAPVATASSVQVRRPIYSGAVDRWRRYGPATERLLAVMAAHGIAPRR